MRRHFRLMGADGREPLYISCEPAPSNMLSRLRALIKERAPSLVIVDPLFLFVRVKKVEDCSKVLGRVTASFAARARDGGSHTHRFSTVQCYGRSLDEVVLVFDAWTETMSPGPST